MYIEWPEDMKGCPVLLITELNNGYTIPMNTSGMLMPCAWGVPANTEAEADEFVKKHSHSMKLHSTDHPN